MKRVNWLNAWSIAAAAVAVFAVFVGAIGWAYTLQSDVAHGREAGGKQQVQIDSLAGDLTQIKVDVAVIRQDVKHLVEQQQRNYRQTFQAAGTTGGLDHAD